jgi:hypothetical protein
MRISAKLRSDEREYPDFSNNCYENEGCSFLIVVGRKKTTQTDLKPQQQFKLRTVRATAVFWC